MADFFSSLLDGLTGRRGYKQKQYSNLSPEQRNLLQPLFGGAGGLNQQLSSVLEQLLNYEPEGLEEMQAPAMQQFQEDIIPSILERFTGANARSSSALNQTLGRAGQGLATNLAAMRANLLQQKPNVRSNAISQLMGLNQFLTNPGMQTNTLQQQANPTADILGILGKLAGSSMFGGF